MSNNMAVHLDKAQFVSAIEFTAAQTGFQPELIEKDYFCSLILDDIARLAQDILIFKGGTLLAKAHAGFYRLSEDLDFTVSISPLATRKERSHLAALAKPVVNELSDRIPSLIVEKKLTGSDESRQYNAEITYPSSLAKKPGRILIEIGLREKVQRATSKEKMSTLLLNPFTQKQIIPPFYFHSLSKNEAYAEKMRASLTRKKVAIRDFYDLDYAIKHNIININDPDFIALLKMKLSLPNTILTNFDKAILDLLKTKISTELMPTLNQSQGSMFDLNKILLVLENFIKKHLSTQL